MSIRVSRRELLGLREWPVPTGGSYSFRFARPVVYVLELEDIHFHLDSAVLLPNERVGGAPEGAPGEATWAGLAAIAACLRYARREPAKKLLIAGHTPGPHRDRRYLRAAGAAPGRRHQRGSPVGPLLHDDLCQPIDRL